MSGCSRLPITRSAASASLTVSKKPLPPFGGSLPGASPMMMSPVADSEIVSVAVGVADGLSARRGRRVRDRAGVPGGLRLVAAPARHDMITRGEAEHDGEHRAEQQAGAAPGGHGRVGGPSARDPTAADTGPTARHDRWPTARTTGGLGRSCGQASGAGTVSAGQWACGRGGRRSGLACYRPAAPRLAFAATSARRRCARWTRYWPAAGSSRASTRRPPRRSPRRWRRSRSARARSSSTRASPATASTSCSPARSRSAAAPATAGRTSSPSWARPTWSASCRCSTRARAPPPPPR